MITDSCIKSVVERILSSYFGNPCKLDRFSRASHSRQSSFALDEIQVNVRHGDRLSLILKRQGPSGLLPQANGSRIKYPYDPDCEPMTYKTLLRQDLGTPRLFGVEIDRSRGRYWLLLEKVEGLSLSDNGDLRAWILSSRWLAHFHRIQGEIDTRPWVHYDASYYRLWRDRAERALTSLQQNKTDSDVHEFADLLNQYEDVITFLAALPRKVIHGEFYASNLIISYSDSEITRICPVDWGTTAVGPTLMDVAALTTGQWGRREKGLILAAYLDESSVRESPEVRYALLCCELHLVLQWIAMWSADRQEGRTWLPQACRIFREVRRFSR